MIHDNTKMDKRLHVNHIQRGRLRGVLSVDVKDVHTVEQLKNVIATRYELARVTLLYRGVNLDDRDQLELEYLIPDLQKIGAPRFSARSILHSTESSELSLFVRMDFGRRTFQVDLPAGSTVADLEQAISDHEGGSNQNLYGLYYGSDELRWDLELAHYNLVSGSTVDFRLTLRGGGGPATVDFVDMENTSALKTVKVVYSRDFTIPRWKCIYDGLSIQGKCQNRRCEAFGSKYVLCAMRFTIFNVAQVVHCPACKEEIKATTCGFSGCQWMFEGRKMKADGSSMDIMSSWKVTPGDEYQWFDDAGRQNIAEWSSLVITVKKRDHGTGNCCSTCFGKLGGNSSAQVGRIIAPACGHKVHSDCATELGRWGYTSCPTCRSPWPSVPAF